MLKLCSREDGVLSSVWIRDPHEVLFKHDAIM